METEKEQLLGDKNNPLGRNIKKLRKKKGLSQQDMADDLEISRTLLSHYETGAREPKTSLLSRIAKTLGVTVGHLLTDIGTSESTYMYSGDLSQKFPDRDGEDIGRPYRELLRTFRERYPVDESGDGALLRELLRAYGELLQILREQTARNHDLKIVLDHITGILERGQYRPREDS